MPLTATTRRKWTNEGNKSQRVALYLDEWAARQEPGTIVPADDVIVARYPSMTGRRGEVWTTTRANARRAVELLAERAVLHRDRNTGHYHVSATRPAFQVT